MHRFLVGPDAIAGERVTFSDAQAHQIRHVLRLRPGDTIVVFDGTQPADLVAELTSPNEGRIIEARAQAPEPRTQLVVYPALLQRDKFETVLQKLTELGACAIAPVISARSLVREPPDERRLERWASILREAAEQSGRGVVPRLRETLAFEIALARACGEGRIMIAHPSGEGQSLKTALSGASETVSLLVGPEGGFEATEIDLARLVGAQVVTLGPRILRAETASPVLAALVLYTLGDLSSGPV